ncbi:DUF5810 domain-containing protein [Salinirubrum litoreum]|uniref:DUF5810 domain-containing protein n=1 Tax=Salinirubrum litoreum TaxID=1126234 RepID=A0ABD5R5Z1_9EURY|nr:DUF5810 domain-containing protein [Salinirubrum litoreum]
MGYACPVCEVPQQDAEHLANHLAFTALLHEDDHADWLDESVPDWREGGPEDLAPQVADLAEESDYDAVFEDTTDDHAGHGHADHAHQHGDRTGHDLGVDPAAAGRQAASAELDAEAQSVLQEARAMTREMLDDGDDEEADASADGRADAASTDAETPDEDADGNS